MAALEQARQMAQQRQMQSIAGRFIKLCQRSAIASLCAFKVAPLLVVTAGCIVLHGVARLGNGRCQPAGQSDHREDVGHVVIHHALHPFGERAAGSQILAV
jgi:hypothetical protein